LGLRRRSLFDFLWSGDRVFEVLRERSLFDFLWSGDRVFEVLRGRSLFDFWVEAIVIFGFDVAIVV